ncbi:MAG: glycosyltransferase family 2 protein [Rhodanobacteraceae bacterium]|nr:glycosyltransferase family 2 protein [Rhodanobacteraceae bacterium]
MKDTEPRLLVIQVPSFNEAATLPATLSDLPTSMDGFDVVEWLVIDDGSSDETAVVARESGAHHITRHPVNRGLSAAFMSGLDTAIARGASVIVNTDADNQYDARDIQALVEPILSGRADMVIGARPIATTDHFSVFKKALQRIGSWVVRLASGTAVADAPSGFRAFSRDAAARLNVFNDYTYTLETIIQAGRSNLRVVSVPIRTNPDLRPSRLVKSIPRYVWRSAITIIRIFATYRPMLLFVIVALAFLAISLASGGWYLYWKFMGEGTGHVQSAILAMGSGTIAFFTMMLGFVADLVGVNRRLLERIVYQSRMARFEQRGDTPPASNGSPE